VFPTSPFDAVIPFGVSGPDGRFTIQNLPRDRVHVAVRSVPASTVDLTGANGTVEIGDIRDTP